MAMFKPALPYVIFYTQKYTSQSQVTISEEEKEEARVGVYVGINGRNYLSALKKRMDPVNKNTHKPQVPVTSNDIPVFTYFTYKYKAIIFSEKDYLISPDYFKHFVISEYSFSIFHPPKSLV